MRFILTAVVTAVIHCWAKNAFPSGWDQLLPEEKAGWPNTCWYLFISNHSNHLQNTKHALDYWSHRSRRKKTLFGRRIPQSMR